MVPGLNKLVRMYTVNWIWGTYRPILSCSPFVSVGFTRRLDKGLVVSLITAQSCLTYNWTLCNTWYTVIFVAVVLPDTVPVNCRAIVLHFVRDMDDHYQKVRQFPLQHQL